MNTKNEQYLQSLLSRARAAQKIFEEFDQASVDKVVKALGKAIFDHAETLAIEAVQETGMGNVPSKIRKQQGIAMSHWDYIKDKKSVGVIEVDTAAQVITYAKPIGVIACITPTTNPTSTVCGNGMYALKSRNAMIVAPHPRSKNVSKHGVDIVRKAIREAGAPEDLLLIVEEPNIEITQRLIQICDAVIATGGPAMVKAAYSSGRPSYGVGAGNVQSIMDRNCTEFYQEYAANTILCRTTDNGIQCTAEQCLHLPEEEVTPILDAFVRNGAYVVEKAEDIEKVRRNLFVEVDGSLRINIDFVGKTAAELATIFGINVPKEVKVLMLKGNGTADTEPLCREKLCPVITYMGYKDFDEAIDRAYRNLSTEGAGHSSILFSKDQQHIDAAAKKLPVGRLSINTANTVAGGNSPSIGYNPTISLGCGSWGNNSISENLTYRHLMNVTKVGSVISNVKPYDPQTVWE